MHRSSEYREAESKAFKVEETAWRWHGAKKKRDVIPES